MRYGCCSGAQGCETLVNLSPWGSIFQRKTISTYFVFIFIFYNLNNNVSEDLICLNQFVQTCTEILIL